MIEDLISAIFALFAVWGAVGAVYSFLLFLARPKKGAKAVILLPLSGPADDAVARVSCLLARLSAAGDARRVIVAALCEPSEAELKKALLEAFRRDERVRICTSEEFYSDYLREGTLFGT